MKIEFTINEIELLLKTVVDYRWCSDFSNNELAKMKRKLNYYIKKEK